MTARILIALTSLTLLIPGRADVLELKNGQVFSGRFAGGSSGVLRFETGGGVQVLETSQLITLTFTSPPAAPPPSAPAPAPAPANASRVITLPAGTLLLVRLMDSVSSKNRPGTPFTTKLEYDLSVGGVPVARGGTIIYGKVLSSTQAGRAFGRSTLDLRLMQMVINGQPVSIVSSGFQQAGQASIAKAAKGAAAGAAIGAIAGDAGKGAAIGATAGALLRGQTITVTPGTLLEFTLSQPVTLPVAN